VPKNVLAHAWRPLAGAAIGLLLSAVGGPLAQAAEFNAPSVLAVNSYQMGILTSRFAVESSSPGWVVSGFKRSPETFKEEKSAPVTLAFRDRGYLEASMPDGSKLIWETPSRLISVRNDQRVTYTSEYPILKFSPELLAADRIVLQSYLAKRAGPSFSIAALEDAGLVNYSFVQAEERTGGSGHPRIWRWGGSKPSHPGMYEKTNLVMTAPFDLLVSESQELVGWNNPSQDIVTIVDGDEGYSTVADWQKETVSKAQYTTVRLEGKQLVPMADGTPLAATILVPGDANGMPVPGRFPTILMRTPYGREHFVLDAFKFVSRVYVVVSQDVRGRGDSQGTFSALHEDIADGNSTLNWIASQIWSDGKIGMIGGSYLAWVQWQAAASGNPHLKTMVSIVPTFGPFIDLPYVNGMFSAGLLTLSVYMGSTEEQFQEAMKKDLNAIASQLPLIDADVRAVGHEIPFWRDWVTHSTMDEYWQQGNVLNYQKKIDLPVLHITGWYDDVLRGSMAAYGMMKANKRANQQLIVGPWPHLVNTVRSLSELSFGPDGVKADMHYTYVRWFDHWLKGIDNAAEADPPVRYFTMGENKWHTAEEWPPKNTVKRDWYLQDSKELATDSPRGSHSPDLYSSDPGHPVPYLVDIRGNQGSAPEDYQELERRSDVLSYSTETLHKPFEITGDSSAVIYAATDQRDTDWVVRVTDVFPDGRSVSIIDGYLRAGFRNGMQKEELLKPGEIVKYTIPLTWTSYRFAEGHKIHVIIASSAAGSFVVNTNTGNPMGTDTQTRIAKQSIYHSAKYPSHIEVSTPK
jgi:uncharacterized protein